MAKKQDVPKKKFDRKHLFWIVPLGIVLILLVSMRVAVWRDYQDDYRSFGKLTELSQKLTDSVTTTVNEIDGLSISSLRDYCSYEQDKFGRSGEPMCGREIVLRDNSAGSNAAERLEIVLERELDVTVNGTPTEGRYCSVRDFSDSSFLVNCYRHFNRWVMYDDLPGKTYN